jgi:predicted glycoside hydrolase/deacetylase ChbG (UPF0249 family)
VNSGILSAFREGILTSATIMANGDAFDEAAEVALSNPGLALGCHLVVVGGRPVAPAEKLGGLVDEHGRLPKTLGQLSARLAKGSAKSAHIEVEFAAQIEKVVAAGIAPSHLDTHKHAHMHPVVMRALVRVATRLGITRVRNPFGPARNGFFGLMPAGDRGTYLKQYAASVAVAPGRMFFTRAVRLHKIRTPDFFYGVPLTGLLSPDILIELIRRVPEGTSELMCHPGAADFNLHNAPTRLKAARQQELAALMDPEVRRAAERAGIEFINYRGIV